MEKAKVNQDSVERDKSFDIKKDSFIHKLQTLEKSDPELVLSWMGGLTDLEQKVISLLYTMNQAVPIKKIRLDLVWKTISLNEGAYLRIPKRYPLHYCFPFNCFYFLSKEQSKKLREIRVEDDSSEEIRLKLVTVQDMLKFPSFRSIDNTVQDLIELGIVSERKSNELTNKKVKGLYFLNPFIRNQLKKLEVKK